MPYIIDKNIHCAAIQCGFWLWHMYQFQSYQNEDHIVRLHINLKLNVSNDRQKKRIQPIFRVIRAFMSNMRMDIIIFQTCHSSLTSIECHMPEWLREWEGYVFSSDLPGLCHSLGLSPHPVAHRPNTKRSAPWCCKLNMNMT